MAARGHNQEVPTRPVHEWRGGRRLLPAYRQHRPTRALRFMARHRKTHRPRDGSEDEQCDALSSRAEAPLPAVLGGVRCLDSPSSTPPASMRSAGWWKTRVEAIRSSESGSAPDSPHADAPDREGGEVLIKEKQDDPLW